MKEKKITVDEALCCQAILMGQRREAAYTEHVLQGAGLSPGALRNRVSRFVHQPHIMRILGTAAREEVTLSDTCWGVIDPEIIVLRRLRDHAKDETTRLRAATTLATIKANAINPERTLKLIESILRIQSDADIPLPEQVLQRMDEWLQLCARMQMETVFMPPPVQRYITWIFSKIFAVRNGYAKCANGRGK